MDSHSPGTVTPANMNMLEHPHDAPWSIPLTSLASGCAVTKPQSRQDGTPALVKTSIRWCRHYSAGNDGQKFQCAEERLQCEVAEANRILLTVVEGVAQDTAEPFYEGLESDGTP